MKVRHKLVVLFVVWTICMALYFVQSSLKFPPDADGLHKTSLHQDDTQMSTNVTEIPLKDRHYLCVRCMGGLGNHMFQYAAMFGIAKRRRMVPLLDENDQLRKYFNIWAVNKTIDGRTCHGMKLHSEKRSSAFDLETITFPDERDTEIHGYLQTFRYFDNVVKDIRLQYQFPINTVHRAKQILDERIRSLSLSSKDLPTLVAVHVRRGDREADNNVKLGITVAPIEYIKHAQAYFLRKYKNVIFVVCSDTFDWCTANIDSPQTIFMKDNSLDIDMAIMLQCNHTILTVGTFGWWVGWLVNGETIYYKKRFEPNSRLSLGWNMSDHYPANWIAML